MAVIRNRVDLYWFSGSGNTLQAAQFLAARLGELGHAVRLLSMERSDASRYDPDATLLLSFPTHCFSIPESVRSFVRRFPRGRGSYAMMLGTHGAVSGGVLGPMKRLLTRKGFCCLAGKIISMPDSFFPFFGPEKNERHMKRAMGKIASFAEQIDCGDATWPRWPIFSDVCGALGAALFSSRRMTRATASTLHLRQSACTGCRICEQYCPVGAIEISATQTLRRRRDCVNCLRCVALCPHDAVRHLIGFAPYRSESAEELRQRFTQIQIGRSPPLPENASLFDRNTRILPVSVRVFG